MSVSTPAPDLIRKALASARETRQLEIGHRTVQRRIQVLMQRLGATSRFQAGVLAARRGWWNPDDAESPRPAKPRSGVGAGSPTAGSSFSTLSRSFATGPRF